MKITSAIMIISLVSSCRAQSGTFEKETLRLGVLFFEKGSIPAVEMALETIEADETLPFLLTYTRNESMVRVLFTYIAIVYHRMISARLCLSGLHGWL